MSNTDPDLRRELNHYRGLCRSQKFELERLEVENANLRRKLQQQPATNTGRRWPDATDGRMR